MSRPVRLVSVLMVVLILIGLALSPTGEAFFTHLLLVLLDWQRYLQRGLTMALTRFSGEASLSHALWLLGLSLGYGIFHAVGPGHGKAVISTYLLTHRAALGRGLRLTAAAALMQGVVAVALVGSLTLGLGMLTRESMASSAIIERISFALVVALGGVADAARRPSTVATAPV
ncbi:nickel/cobalt transporter [Kushneria sinocarnis]|uniref:nickel/cobalt transporter n=1 Tax=Kushneria sinocarnis TaxID=595502 RepID=UPI001FE3702B|nr:hypothetical protein [Kushneria sinocarnis]